MLAIQQEENYTKDKNLTQAKSLIYLFIFIYSFILFFECFPCSTVDSSEHWRNQKQKYTIPALKEITI